MDQAGISDEEFARRLRMVRAYLDFTLEDASRELGLATSTISQRERAGGESGQKIGVEPRRYMASVYCRLTGWPEEFFTEETIPSLPGFGLAEDDLEPAEVVELVERDRDDDGEGRGHG